MDDVISAIEYTAIQAIFIWLSCNENDQEKERSTAGLGRMHISSNHMARFNQHIGYDGTDTSNCSGGRTWNVALVTCRIFSRKDGSHRVDTVEDDDGLE
ncbi:predicted protein [Lichtheimia corymbifera JMRC:FSU:9682]|uniref:Uncharacterized protein n=1 Tax=Lichtheimia corymbifera JMRC:FSU:9682 TaxID=1263082 RepID=A0A068RK56_9FUNG|nr:predicted protein [Lichtheimia corymbifera JMRC:FSU:9682]